MKFNYNFLAQRYFIISVFLNVLLFGFSFAKADSQHPEAFPQLNAYELSVWKIHSPGVGDGTGFFIEENHFVTNFHVISPMLRGSGSLTNIALSQEGNTSVLKVKEILAVSAVYDLALLETEESVTNYLQLGENLPELNVNLSSIAYPDGVFAVINKTGDILYENDHLYIFPVDNSSLSGASGSPVLDERGHVIGVNFQSLFNLAYAIKINPLQELIKGNIGIKCIKSVSAAVRFFKKECIKKEKERLQKLAEEGYDLAQYQLADIYKELDIDKAVKWYKKAANQGYVLAQHNLGTIYANGERVERDLNEAIRWDEKAMEEQGFIPSQAALGFLYLKMEKYPEAFQLLKLPAEKGYVKSQALLADIYHSGDGIEKNLEKAFYWYQKAARQGYSHAQFILAGMYYLGEGVEKNIEKALYWARRAEEQEYPLAPLLLPQLLQ